MMEEIQTNHKVSILIGLESHFGVWFFFYRRCFVTILKHFHLIYVYILFVL